VLGIEPKNIIKKVGKCRLNVMEKPEIMYENKRIKKLNNFL
jgi:hypothetical protein